MNLHRDLCLSESYGVVGIFDVDGSTHSLKGIDVMLSWRLCQINITCGKRYNDQLRTVGRFKIGSSEYICDPPFPLLDCLSPRSMYCPVLMNNGS